MNNQNSHIKTPQEYIAKLDEPRRSEIQSIHDLIIKTMPQYEPYMISGMLGYGHYHYKYASGREGDWCVIGLASNKGYISIYICAVKDGRYLAECKKDELHASVGKSCIRYKRFADFEQDKQLLISLFKEAASI